MGASEEKLRIALRVAYEGSSYWGFSRQPGRPTVEWVLLSTLERMGVLRGPGEGKYEAAGRTDRGVGALGMVVAFNSTRDLEVEGLNSLLPPDLVVLSAERVPPSFSPRREALFRHYRYVLPLPEPFNLVEVRRGAKLLETAYTFTPFCKLEPGRHYSCKPLLVGVREEGGSLKADFVATNFLYQQVRRMMGALLKLGEGRMELEELWRLTRKGGKTGWEPAPPEGLFLVEVGYWGRNLVPLSSALERFSEYLTKVPTPRNLEMRRILKVEFEDLNKERTGNFRIWRETSLDSEG